MQETEGQLLQNSSNLKRSNKLYVEELSEKTENLTRPWKEVDQTIKSTNDILRPKSGETRKQSSKKGHNGHTATELSHDSIKVSGSSKPKRAFNARFPRRSKPKEHKSKTALEITSPQSLPQTGLDNKGNVTAKVENKRMLYSSHIAKQPTDVSSVQPLFKIDKLIKSQDEAKGTKTKTFEEEKFDAALNIEDIGHEFPHALHTRDNLDVRRVVQVDNASTILSKQSTVSTVASEPMSCSPVIVDKAEILCGSVPSTQLLHSSNIPLIDEAPEHRKPETHISTLGLVKAGPRLVEEQTMTLGNDRLVTTTEPQDLAICSYSNKTTTVEKSTDLTNLVSPKWMSQSHYSVRRRANPQRHLDLVSPKMKTLLQRKEVLLKQRSTLRKESGLLNCSILHVWLSAVAPKYQALVAHFQILRLP